VQLLGDVKAWPLRFDHVDGCRASDLRHAAGA
jgi:hypothetical protein